MNEMYCPKCKNEYLEGVKECPDCKVTLVDELEPETPKDYTRILKGAILLSICALCYVFLVHFIGTFFVSFFRNLVVARVTTILHLFFALVMLFFYIIFLLGYVKEEQKRLKVSTVLVIVGDFFIFLILLKGALSLFFANGHPFLQKTFIIEPIIPWVSSLFLLIFFINFYKDTILSVSRIFSKSIFWAIFGAFVGLMVRTFMLLSYFCSGLVRWIFDLPPSMIVLLLPIVSFSFVTHLIFFILFYREL
jgi:hypothetical protein